MIVTNVGGLPETVPNNIVGYVCEPNAESIANSISKFYTEIDNESSPMVGVFIGWQICKEYFKKKPDVKLVDFIKLNATDIFNVATYKPKLDN